MGKKRNSPTEYEDSGVTIDLVVTEETPKERKKSEFINHQERPLQFQDAGVRQILVDKYVHENGAVEECEKNLAEARKRRMNAYRACELDSRHLKRMEKKTA